jgi:cellulose synthase operon protein YhjQ
MGISNDEKRATPSGVEEELAKDVARLYSWANVEGAGYRSFPRQRKHSSAQPVQLTESSPGPAVVHDPVASGSPATEIQATPLPQAVAPATNAAPAVSPVPKEAPQDFRMVPQLRGQAENFQPTPTSRWTATHPALAIYSLAGGVGKTTLSANLARVLCSFGERVLLVDASGSGLLPFYFGAGDLRAGLRTFEASGVNYPPLQIIGADEVSDSWLENDVKPIMLRSQRIIFDLGPASTNSLPQIFGMCSAILVPLLSDLNSILTVSRIEASLQTMRSKGVNAPTAYYLFNRFDESSSMDQQARALVVRQCGDRLLPITIHQGAEVAEAIAARMTVADHAPQSEVTNDYLELAEWLRKIAPSSPVFQFSGRWSER